MSRLLPIAAALLLSVGSLVAQAGEVKVYRGNDTVDPGEVARILGPVKMRTLRLLDDGPAGSVATTSAAAAVVAVEASRPSALSLPVQFAFDSADILPSARPQLDAIAAGIRMLPATQTVVIEGHTDAVGSELYNESPVAAPRPVGASRYLVTMHGIDASAPASRGPGRNAARCRAATRWPARTAACSSAASEPRNRTSQPTRIYGVAEPIEVITMRSSQNTPTRSGWTTHEVLRLLGRIEQADEGAFRELYCAFSRKLYAYVLRQLSDPAQAEEIVADTLYEVWKAPAKFRGDSQFSTWLIGIARNKVLMALAQRASPTPTTTTSTTSPSSSPSDAPGAFDILAAASSAAKACAPAWTSSADEHRECVHLVFYEGMALADVARIQQMPRGHREDAPVPCAPEAEATACSACSPAKARNRWENHHEKPIRRTAAVLRERHARRRPTAPGSTSTCASTRKSAAELQLVPHAADTTAATTCPPCRRSRPRPGDGAHPRRARPGAARAAKRRRAVVRRARARLVGRPRAAAAAAPGVGRRAGGRGGAGAW